MFGIEDWTKNPANFAFKQNMVIQLIRARSDFRFDLIIYQDCSQESWLMFAHKFKAPIVIIGKANHLGFGFFYILIMIHQIGKLLYIFVIIQPRRLLRTIGKISWV